MVVEVVDYRVNVNGHEIDIDNSLYPVVTYKDITYFPLTYDLTTFLGLELHYSNDSGLCIKKTDGSEEFEQQFLNGSYSKGEEIKAKLVTYQIEVNSKIIDNNEETYPILNINNVTYIPMTWNYGVEEFGWNLSWDNSNGLSIDKSGYNPISTNNTDEQKSFGPEIIREIITDEHELYYVGVYEGHDIKLRIAETKAPVILFLTSYDSVNWIIDNPAGTKIDAVIYSSYSNDTTISYTQEDDPQLIELANLVRGYSLDPIIYKVGHGYHVEHGEFGELDTQIIELTGRRLDGFSGEYSGGSITVPDVILDDTTYLTIKEKFDEIEQLINDEPDKPSNLFNEYYSEESSAEKSWGNIFTKDIIDISEFTATYFNTEYPIVAEKRESVVDAGITFAWNYGTSNHGPSSKDTIPAEDFGAYWVKEINLSEEVTKNIDVEMSWAFCRIWIDNQVVFDESSSGPIEYTFSKGKHLIEIEFINDWHTVDFLFTLSDKDDLMSINLVKSELKNIYDANTEVYYIGLYHSSDYSKRTVIDLSYVQKPTIVVISSRANMYYDVVNADENVKAIIYSSMSNGSNLECNNKKTKLYKVEDLPYIYELNGGETASNKVPVESRQYGTIVRFANIFEFDMINGFTGHYEESYIGRPQIQFIETPKY